MKLYPIYITALLGAFFFSSCESEAPEVDFAVTADKLELAVGEPLTLSISHNDMLLTVYNGEEGHNYELSADYILSGKADTALQHNNYRPVDPEIQPYACDLANTPEGNTSVKDNQLEVRNANSGDNLIGTEASITADNTINQNVLKITSTHPDWWYQAIRINMNAKLGANKTLTLRMRFDKDYLEDISTGTKNSDYTTFPVVIRLGGVPEGEDGVVFSDNTVWDIYWNPSTTYMDYSIDLARTIKEWESGTGKQMAKLAYAQILFTANGSVGYVGDFYVQKATYGDYDYKAFDTGEAISTDAGPGVVTYKHTYNKPGTYKIVVIGSTVGNKNYSNGGYKDGYADKISADEYKYNKVLKTIGITVK